MAKNKYLRLSKARDGQKLFFRVVQVLGRDEKYFFWEGYDHGKGQNIILGHKKRSD